MTLIVTEEVESFSRSIAPTVIQRKKRPEIARKALESFMSNFFLFAWLCFCFIASLLRSLLPWIHEGWSF